MTPIMCCLDQSRKIHVNVLLCKISTGPGSNPVVKLVTPPILHMKVCLQVLGNATAYVVEVK